MLNHSIFSLVKKLKTTILNVTEIMFSKFLWIIIAFVIIFYFYLKYIIFSYWNKTKVPHVPPALIFGNINSDFLMNRVTIGDMVKDYYNQFRKEKYFGMYIFHNPILVINDPELIRLILVKDFQYFADRGIHSNVDYDPMSFNLFRLPGEKWRHLRTKLSPIFTSGKLKQLYPLLLDVSNELIDVCEEDLKFSDIVDAKDIVERFITDCISTVAFGFNCNSLKNPNNEFRNYGKLGTDMGKYSAVISIFGSNIVDFFRLPIFKSKVDEFFIKIFRDVVTHRIEEKVVRNDFINMLMDITDCENTSDKNSINGDKLNMVEAAAQVFVFFIAGFETTSTTLTYCLHELAKFPEIQTKLQKEIDEAANSPSGFNYENIMSMKYLDMVFSETLRKHPPVPFINRLCTKDYQIPNSNIIVPKGMRLAISVSGLQNDPDIFPDPERFDPLRFSKENCTDRSSYYFLPFGEGPRICIAKRIAFMQGKLGLAVLLHKFNFSICEDTPIPLQYSNRTFLLVTDDKLYLRVTRR
ncbi:probable cytochrome P450 6a14 [Phymastichus coffea]|uniref:probable cytochrome P450 6a14 n=1 Tax=Phymastichus coffea TaxID=108790 RepID=UPI00273AF4BD|nr:probable cytochrome P450 6a14 [Phymastichus coffea]